MSQPWVDDAKFFSQSTLLSSFHPVVSQSSSYSSLRHSHRNVCQLLAWREISPRAKHYPKKLWGETLKQRADCIGLRCETIDAQHALISWVEAESLRHLSAKYCPLLPPPRSTIAAAFSSNGKTLASTHGDHTVKIIDCQTGNCLKVLSGHRRTPWVVRFHPLHSDILASGSLDHEVRLWDARTADCIGSRDFYRPIASIAFHAQGELLAVASGHKLYIWNYNKRGEASSPMIVLRTRRSLRAVHFHPHAAPFLLTAEVNDLDSPDSPLTLATTSGYLHYPPPAVFLANLNSTLRSHLEAKVPLIPYSYLFWPTFVKEDGRVPPFRQGSRANSSVSGQQRPRNADIGNQDENFVTAMDISPGEPSSSNIMTEDAFANSMLTGMETVTCDSVMGSAENTEGQPTMGFQQRSSPGMVQRLDSFNNGPSTTTFHCNGVAIRIPVRQSRPGGEDASPAFNSSNSSGSTDLQLLLRSVEGGQLHQFIPFSDPACWELPFLQGWLMGQTHAGLHTAMPVNSPLQGSSSIVRGTGADFLTPELLYTRNVEALVASSSMVNTGSHARVTGRSSSQHRLRSRLVASIAAGEGSSFLNAQNDEAEPHPGPHGIESEIPTSLPATAAAELPCTVKLRIWRHDIQDPFAPLDPETCRLTIPHAVLCSEMGAHFSPCGRFLVACVACLLPHMEGDPGVQLQMQHDGTGAATSPTRHPISAHQVMYELRIYSLEEATFGMVLASRAIRAAHCLTSIQFSPTSEHILLAYGRRHSSLLRSIVVDGETAIPIYTILEIYRVSDMELVRVLPSAEDEVNVACFHPSVGGGLVYGTKEGKLRILQYDGPHDTSCAGPNFFLEENMLEIQKYALEC
ncbi:uncharacterized protein [Elaeis guineensis]|uniref:Uncharacterized protein LOC105055773 isoform X1 n=1 Tax=Elaeis guineensis var. tenera TaxID=51953 RepID=A0A6I9S138_ELAGV|nr:uncharacterized protein LOC105055773 isoform X1 [Elaeis guineensis]XP_010936053.1 uncharacterized protein LOC105055773 isoform X1 [Elaeis guineensis]XP_019709684.1 uncharacterized protein LOC105055773 isoform X1 [Elaeis guineensis]XP_019709685.1 uncharacterized protein LOC105055773 isoform X1 [Elaeis guineensis]XP_029123570.1 uncharacterized protein LOC105055773 isoform X1 [Elaeis guineensis]XP_029123571.1 uncharacterized protein LOC105055773 isoform X1 [Elaeis guineensis]